MSDQGTGKTLWALDCPEHPDSPWPHRLFGNEDCNGGKREASPSEIIEAARNLPGAEEAHIEFDATLRAYVVDGAVLDDGVYVVIPIADARRTRVPNVDNADKAD